jgi:hypothetical protein
MEGTLARKGAPICARTEPSGRSTLGRQYR